MYSLTRAITIINKEWKVYLDPKNMVRVGELWKASDKGASIVLDLVNGKASRTYPDGRSDIIDLY